MTYRLHAIAKLDVADEAHHERTGSIQGWIYAAIIFTIVAIIASVYFMVKGTPYEDASEHFKGVTGIVWTENDPVVLSKTISKFIKDNADIYTLKPVSLTVKSLIKNRLKRSPVCLRKKSLFRNCCLSSMLRHSAS